MSIHKKKNYDMYMEITEYFFRKAVSRRFNDVRGAVTQTWYQGTLRWIEEKCNQKERALIDTFYTRHKSVQDCTNDEIIESIYNLIDRFAMDMDLHK